MLLLLLVLGSRSRFAKLHGLLIAGDVLNANDMLATTQRYRFRECTCLTRFGVLGRSRGAPCAGHTAQTPALRCVKVAQARVPLTQGASVFVSWSAAIR